MSGISRRKLIKRTGAALGVSLFGLPLSSKAAEKTKLKVIVTGGHPDDPETGCGGLIARLAKEGHEVVIAYLTRGEAGIPGTSHDDAAAIRTKEAQDACKILGCRAHFMGQIDGDTIINKNEYKKAFEFLDAEQPDLLFTHWPIDTHRDHRACSAIIYAAWLWMHNKPDLYFYEVLTGGQTQNFSPTDFVDITDVRSIKHAACFAHKSQDIEKYYAGDHGKMEEFRGLEGRSKYAEAYVRHFFNPQRLI